MKKYPLIGVCIIAVVLLVLGSLSNVVGYQTVQTSQQNLIKERINQRELLFQTIIDIANNKEIQRIILESQMSRGIFPVSEIPVLTKNQLKQLYFIGLILSKFISKSKMQSMVRQYQLINPVTQQEISAVIEKDATLNGEITQLQNSECDCENESTIDSHFPIICSILFQFGYLGNILYWKNDASLLNFMGMIIFTISVFFAFILTCSWILP
ncbi:MAG TPA: hypothetical protein VMY59_08515 [Candidatus Thermoplasmatota archaeon]|nr:hypothetical protein [Candidatus Thermoplasmatota archaeon]